MDNDTLVEVLKRFEKPLGITVEGYNVVTSTGKLDVQTYYARIGMGALRKVFTGGV